MSIIGSIAQYVRTQGRLLYADCREALFPRAGRSKRRRNPARSKYMEMMEPRVLMTTIVGGQTFTYTDAHGNPVTVTLQGNTIAEIVGMRRDGSGAVFGDITGRYNDGRYAGNGSVFLDGSTSTSNATINIPGLAYPSGAGPGNRVNLQGLASSSATGKTYVFNLYNVDSQGEELLSTSDTNQNIWVMQVIELSTSGGTHSVLLTLTGDQAQSLLPIGVNNANQTQTKAYTDVRIAGAAFNPADNRLYFDLTYKLETNTTSETTVGTTSTTTTTTATTYVDRLYSFNTAGNTLTSIGDLAMSRQQDGTPNLEVKALTFNTSGTTTTMYVAYEPPSAGGNNSSSDFSPQLSSFAVAANGTVTPGTALTTVELREGISNDEMTGVSGLAPLPASEPYAGGNYIFATVNAGSQSRLVRIDVASGAGVVWGDTLNLYLNAGQRGDTPFTLTYNPVMIDPHTGRQGTFLMMDSGNRYLLMALNHEFRVSRGDAFAVYSNQSDISSMISFEGASLYSGSPTGQGNSGTVFLGYNGEYVQSGTAPGFRGATAVSQAAMPAGIGILPGYYAASPGNFTRTLTSGVYFSSNMERPFVPNANLLDQMINTEDVDFINARGLAISPSGTIVAITSDADNGPDFLGFMNRVTGQADDVIAIRTAGGADLKNVQGLAYGDPNLTGNASLYAVYEINGRPTLGTINTNTGIFTPLGSSIFTGNSHGRVYAIMFTPGGTPSDPTHQSLYVIADPNWQDGNEGQYLYQVSPSSGSILSSSTAPSFTSTGIVTATGGLGLVYQGDTTNTLSVAAAMFNIDGTAIVLDRKTGRLMDLNLTSGQAGFSFASQPGVVNPTIGGMALDPITLSIIGIDNDTSFRADSRHQLNNGTDYTARMVYLPEIGATNDKLVDIGAFLFDGALPSNIFVTGSVDTIYAGNFSGNITVGGDLHNLISIGNISGAIDVGGKIGQVYTLGTVQATLIRAGNVPTVATVPSATSFSGSFLSSLDAYAYNFRGSATGVGGFLSLTSGLPNQAGSAFLNTLSAFDTFTAQFTVSALGSLDGGFAFVLQNQSQNPLGGSGAGLGYSGILNSAALEFNYDPATGGSSMGFRTNGQIGYSPLPFDITALNSFTVDLSYDGTTLTVSLNGGTYTTSFLTNLTSIIGTRGAYVGFTGSSGTAGSFTDIVDFSFVGANPNVPRTGVTHDVNTWGFLSTELFLDNQTQTRFSSYTFATAQYLGAMFSPIANGEDVIHLEGDGSWAGTNNIFYSVPLLAGKTVEITVGPINGVSSDVQHFAIYDPEGNEVTNSFNTFDQAQTQGRTIRLTPDMPGNYRIEVIDPTVYQLTVRGIGNLAIGGVVGRNGVVFNGTAETITANSGDIGSIVGNARGGSGQVYAPNGVTGLTSVNTSPTGYEFGTEGSSDVYAPNGSLRAMVGQNIGSWNSQTQTVSAVPDIYVNGTVGLLMTTDGSDILALSMTHAAKGPIQMISATGELGGYFRSDKAIGVIRAGSVTNDIYDTEFHADVDRQGNDGIIDLIDVDGDWGVLGNGAPIVTGPGGNVRMMRVRGLLYQDAAFSTGGNGTPVAHDAGEAVTYVDDSGAIVTLTPGSFTTGTGTSQTTTQGQLLTDTYGVRGAGGVIILAVTSSASLTISVAAGGTGLAAEIGTVSLSQAGVQNVVTNGVPAMGAANTQNSMSNLTVSASNEGRVDIFDIRSDSTINNITNNTLGDLYNITAEGLGVVTAKGNIGVQNVSGNTGTAMMPFAQFGTDAVFTARQRVGVQTNGTTAIVASIVSISSARAIGAIESSGVVGTITADSDNTDDVNAFEGLSAPIVVLGSVNSTQNTTDSSNQISLNRVNIGEGIVPSQQLLQGFASGIYAIGTIWNVTGTRGDIMGNINSNRHIGTISLTNSSIISGSIHVFTDFAMSSVNYGGTRTLPEFTQVLSQPVYNIDSINIQGNGGIIGGWIAGASINNIVVGPQGFGIFTTSINGVGIGTINNISAGGYGIRNVYINNAVVKNISATGSGAELPISNFSSRVRNSEQTIFHPFTNQVNNALTDLPIYLLGDGVVNTPDAPGLTSGVIYLAAVSGQETLGNVSAYNISTSYFRFPGGTGSFTVKNDVDNVQILTGKISSISVGNDASNFEVTAAGAIGNVTIGGDFYNGTNNNVAKAAQIVAKGPSGTINSVAIKGSFEGLILANGKIGSITIGTAGNNTTPSSGDFTGTITIGGNGLTGSVLDLLKVYGSLSDGLIQITGGVGTIDVAHDFTIADPVIISGALNNLIVGSDPVVNGSVFSSSLRVGGNLVNATVTGFMNGEIVVLGNMTKLTLNSDPSNVNGILLPGTIQVAGTITGATIQGSVTGRLLGGAMGTIVVSGALLGGILSGKTISSATITGGMLAGSTVSSALGDITKLAVTGNIAGAVTAPNGALGGLTLSGNITDTGSIMVRSLGALTIPGSVAGTLSASLSFTSLKVGTLTSTAYVSSPVLASITTTNDLNGILAIGSSATAIKLTVGGSYGAVGSFGSPLSGTINGSMAAGSAMFVANNLTSLVVKGAILGDILVDRTIGTLNAASITGAVITAGMGFTTLTVSGTMSNTIVVVGLSRGLDQTFGTSDLGEQARMADLTTLSVASMVNSIVTVGGNLTTLKITANMSSSTVATGLVAAGSEISAALTDVTPLADAGELALALQGGTLLRGSIKTATVGPASGTAMFNSTVAAGVSPGSDGIFGNSDDNVNTSLTGGTSAITTFKGNRDGLSNVIADSVGAGATTISYTTGTDSSSIVPANPIIGAPTATAVQGSPAVIATPAGTITVTITGPAGTSVAVYDNATTTAFVDTLLITGQTKSGVTVTVTTTNPGTFDIGRLLTADDTQLTNFTFNGDIVGDGASSPDIWIDSNVTNFTVRNIPNDGNWSGQIGGDVSKLTINQLGPGRLRVGGRIATLTVSNSIGTPMLQQLGTVNPATFLTQVAYDPSTDSFVATDGNNLLDVDVNNGSISSTTPIKTLNGANATLSGLTYSSTGELYGIGSFNNQSPTIEVGKITTTGDTLRGLAINSLGVIYAIDSQAGFDQLVTINPTTGARTLVGTFRDVAANSFNSSIMTLAFDSGNNLYALVNDRDGNGGQYTVADGVGLGKITISGSLVRISNPTASGLPIIQAAPQNVYTAMVTDSQGRFYVVTRTGNTDSLERLTVNGTGNSATVTRAALGDIKVDSGATDTHVVGMGFDENGLLTALSLNADGTASELISVSTTSASDSLRSTLPNFIPQAYNAFGISKSGSSPLTFAYTTDNASGGTLYVSPGVASSLGTVGTDGTFTHFATLKQDADGTLLDENVVSIAVDAGGTAFVLTDAGTLLRYNTVDGSLVGGEPVGTVADSFGNAIGVSSIAFNTNGQLIGMNPTRDNLVQIATTSSVVAGLTIALTTTYTEPGSAPHNNLSALAYNASTGQFISYSAASGNFVAILGTNPDELGGLVANAFGTVSIPASFTSRIAATGYGTKNAIDKITFAGAGTFTGVISSDGGIGPITGSGVTFAGFLVGHGDLASMVLSGSVAEQGVISIDGKITTLTVNGTFDGALFAQTVTTLNLNGAVLGNADIGISGDVATFNVTQNFGGTADVGSIKTLKITGALASGGNFTVLNDVTSASIGSSQLGSIFMVRNSATTLTVAGALNGVIAVRRNVTTATLNAVTSGILDVGGDINNLNVNGNTKRALISAGTWIGDDGIYNTADDVIYGGSIINAKVNGVFTDSLLIAGVLPREGTPSSTNNIPLSFSAYTYNASGLTTADIDSAEGGGIANSSIVNATFSKPVVSSFPGAGQFSALIAADSIGKVTASGQLQQIVRNDPPGAPSVGTVSDPIAGTVASDITRYSLNEIRLAFTKRMNSATLNSNTITVIDDSTGLPITDVYFSYFIRTNPDGTQQGVLQIFSPSNFLGKDAITVQLKGGLDAPTITDRTGLRSALLDYNQDGIPDTLGDPFGTTLSGTISVGVGPPANDSFNNAIEITDAFPTQVSGTNVDASKETGEPNHFGNSGGHSLWYKWTATFDGLVTLDTNGSDFDTLLAVYTGNTVNGLTEIDSDDDSGDGLDSFLQFTAVNGTTYYIAIDGYSGSNGIFVLHFS